MDFTHIANPVRVKAQVITFAERQPNGWTHLKLSDGTKDLASDEMTARYQPVPGDYLVTQDDGYQYLNPKDVFERKYRAIGDTSVIDSGLHGTFGFALMMLKNGHRVARAGWNGKGMFVYLNRGAHDFASNNTPNDAQSVGGAPAALFEKWGGNIVTRLPNLNMRAADGCTVTGWLASQTDMLAEDWQILQDVVA